MKRSKPRRASTRTLTGDQLARVTGGLSEDLGRGLFVVVAPPESPGA